ncbi:putative FBD-associated F-box protein [Cardamine amara subsp. amara]|uniref:FBD-associated F-box protein n=1 Tax=Cardamine amara subsp. amara TaxID=228776 RepID=A0ABD1AYA4_CARAN
MSNICELCDDLLVKILSLVKTKEAVATSVLSKRWLSLWKLVPMLDYGAPLYASGSDFVNNFLLLSNAPVLETLHLRLGDECESEEHERWVDIAVARHVRVLELIHDRFHLNPLPFPRSLFTCKSLVVLRLQEVVIWDIPSTIFLQSLKTLSLLCVTFYYGDELVHRLLSACPILETLAVRRCLEDYVTAFTIAVPSLQSLDIMHRPVGHSSMDDREYIINAPCLKTLKVSDGCSWFRSLVKFPKLVKAEIMIRQEDPKKLLGCLTSAKHLSLCATSARQAFIEKSAGDKNLCQLEYLELCTNCSSDWLCHLLRHSPKLRALRLDNQRHCGIVREVPAQWEQLCSVPECLLSSLETVEWIGYSGTEGEKEAAVYILEKAIHLKKMTLSRKFTRLGEKYRMLIDLASRLSSSIKCRLEFVRL